MTLSSQYLRRDETAYYSLLMLKSDGGRPKTLAQLMRISYRSPHVVERSLNKLIRLGLARKDHNDRMQTIYMLTEDGLTKLRTMARPSPLLRHERIKDDS